MKFISNIMLNRDSIYLKIIAVNLIFIVLFASLLTYNSIYLKSTIKQNIDQTNKDSLLNIAGSIDQELTKIKKSAFSLSMNTDIYSLNHSRFNAAYYEQLQKFNQRLGELNRLMPFSASMYVYFKESGLVTGADGSRKLDLFYNKLRNDSKDFTCNCLHKLEADEVWATHEQFVLYSYQVKNVGSIFVKIDRRHLETYLRNAAAVLNNTITITTADGRLLAGSRPLSNEDITMLDNRIQLDGRSYTGIGLSMNKLQYSILYGENTVQEKMKTASRYTALLFGLFLAIHLFFIGLNLFVYKPISRTIRKLNITNSKMEKTITEQSIIMEQNALLRLASSGTPSAVPQNMLEALALKYRSYYVVSSQIEGHDGQRDWAAIEEFERILSEYCPYQKLLHRHDTDVYIIEAMNETDPRTIVSSVCDRLASNSLFMICGISSYQYDVLNVHSAVQESLLAIERHAYDSDAACHIAYYPDIAAIREVPFTLSLEKEQELIAYVLKGNTEGVERFFNTTIPAIMEKLCYKEIRHMLRYLHDLLNIIVASKKMQTNLSVDAAPLELSAMFGIPAMLALLRKKYSEATTYSTQQDTILYDKIIAYIETNYRLDLSMQMIADHFSISTVYLSSYFKKNAGFNLSYYINTVRIKESIRLMQENKDLPVKEVAGRVGYTNVGTFIRHFKRLNGTTPTQYFSVTT